MEKSCIVQESVSESESESSSGNKPLRIRILQKYIWCIVLNYKIYTSLSTAHYKSLHNAHIIEI